MAIPILSANGKAVNLSLQNVVIGEGISYQWQSSTNGTAGWANVTGGTGANTATYTTAALTAKTKSAL